MIEIGERVAAPVVPVKSVPDVLRHAALVIEERGWCQGALTAPDGSVCLMGAVIRGGEDTTNVEWLASVYMDDWTGLPEFQGELRPAARWNDTPGRTATEVTAALRAAADAYEASHDG